MSSNERILSKFDDCIDLCKDVTTLYKKQNEMLDKLIMLRNIKNVGSKVELKEESKLPMFDDSDYFSEDN